MKCPLCPPVERITRWWYEDEIIAVFACKTCGVPMGILKHHTMDPTLVEAQYLSKKLKELFPDRHLDTRQRSIPNHLHWHMRRKE